MRNRMYASVAAGGAVAMAMLAVAAGAAGAADGVRPDDRATHGPGAVAVAQGYAVVRPDDRADRQVPGVSFNAAPVRSGTARPDDRATHGPGAVGAIDLGPVRPDDRADRRLPGVAIVAQPATVDGFDWVDAGLGAVATLGLALLLAGATILGLRHKPEPA